MTKTFDYTAKCSPNFQYGEFLPPDVHLYHENPAELVTPWLIRVAEALRERFGVMYINTWLWGKTNPMYSRGVRLSKGVSASVGALRSRHKVGLALDCTFKNALIPAVRKEITKDPDKWLQIGIVRVETGVRWLHVDGGLHIQTFNP